MIFKKGYYVVFCLLFALTPKLSFADFDFNANCVKAYQQILYLKFNAAKQLIAQEKKSNPDNAIVPLLENYIDYFYLITNESKAEFERLEANKAKRINLISADKADNSPYKLFALAEINTQWALIRSKYGQYYASSREINKAAGYLKDNHKKFPNFSLNNKGLGLINVVIGSLPDGFMKSALGALGIKGDVNLGLKQLDRLAETLPKTNYSYFYDEVVFYYAYLLSDVVKSPLAYQRTIKYTGSISDESLLKTYVESYVAVRNGKSDKAVALLENRVKGSAYLAFPYLDYLLGVAKLNKIDLSSASNFETFLRINKGDNYIKDAYWHLALVALFKDDTAAYNAFASKTKTSGATYLDKDKQALNEISLGSPNILLLKARLLFDGGYYIQSSAVLATISDSQLKSAKDRAEYFYRFGRVNEYLGKDAAAIDFYTKAIAVGKNTRFYFAARSAVFLGKIYEEKRDTLKAKYYYNQAVSMKDHEYEASIENEAKRALKAL